ncbi:hypothetical protein IU449_17140 [Nocardia higoensis]|uniref:Uncharacterized protein n=1 Tax=Nocardia higoensis TaxID=228599 RepID=A0ABS0DCP8_9NOCA|nr:hypothetical protein [Nocardia higoensis]MBF6356247.1 hypothetical protein [Nocardia higoensis]
MSHQLSRSASRHNPGNTPVMDFAVRASVREQAEYCLPDPRRPPGRTLAVESVVRDEISGGVGR